MPASRHASRSACPTCAVSATIGTSAGVAPSVVVAASDGSPRGRRCPGIWTSMRTSPYDVARHRASAASPLVDDVGREPDPAEHRGGEPAVDRVVVDEQDARAARASERAPSRPGSRRDAQPRRPCRRSGRGRPSSEPPSAASEAGRLRESRAARGASPLGRPQVKPAPWSRTRTTSALGRRRSTSTAVGTARSAARRCRASGVCSTRSTKGPLSSNAASAAGATTALAGDARARAPASRAAVWTIVSGRTCVRADRRAGGRVPRPPGPGGSRRRAAARRRRRSADGAGDRRELVRAAFGLVREVGEMRASARRRRCALALSARPAPRPALDTSSSSRRGPRPLAPRSRSHSNARPSWPASDGASASSRSSAARGDGSTNSSTATTSTPVTTGNAQADPDVMMRLARVVRRQVTGRAATPRGATPPPRRAGRRGGTNRSSTVAVRSRGRGSRAGRRRRPRCRR